MTKRDIIIEVSEHVKVPQKDIRDILEHTMKAIANSLVRGQDVELRNFGVFQVQLRRSRIGRNPNQPETAMVIPEHAVVKFKMGKELRQRMSKTGLGKPSKVRVYKKK